MFTFKDFILFDSTALLIDSSVPILAVVAFGQSTDTVASSDTECNGPPKTLVDWALEILSMADPDKKARHGDLAASRWLRGDIPLPYDASRTARSPPDRPARCADVRLLPPLRMPKLGKGGTAQSSLAMLHSLAHTESWAVDPSWDIVARFAAAMRIAASEESRRFGDSSFCKVAQTVKLACTPQIYGGVHVGHCRVHTR